MSSAHDEDHAVEAGANGVVDGVVQQNLPAGSHRVDLLEAPVAAAHPRSQHQQRQAHGDGSFPQAGFGAAARSMRFRVMR